MINIPEKALSLFGGEVKSPEVSFKIEDDDVGYTIRIIAQNRTLNFEAPKVVSLDTSKFKKSVVSIDVDYYTKKPIDLSNIDFNELIDVVQRNLNHNLPTLFT